MVILRVSPGMANAMLEYAAAYELSKKLNTELAIDLCEHSQSIWPYMLDYWKIPNCKKFIYNSVDNIEHGHYCDIPKQVSENPLVLLQKGEASDDDIVSGKSCFFDGAISEVILEANNSGRDIYLNGYFFGENFCKDYKREVYSMFVSRFDFPELNAAVSEIEQTVSVGVHIRRGDMMYASFAKAMNDAYYCAGIEFFRRKFKGCQFYIFSDDKKYVKELFGKQNDIHYIEFTGFDEADLMEFVCLSKCNHHVLSNSSTYSKLAADLSELDKSEEHIVLFQGDDLNINQRINRCLSYIKNEIKHMILSEKHLRNEVIFSSDLVNRYFVKYKKSVGKNAISLDFETYSVEKKQCSLLKIKNLYLNKSYDRVLGLAYSVYDQLCDNEEFRDIYVDSLKCCNYLKEAQLEMLRTANHNIELVVMAEEQQQLFGCENNEMRLARALGHLGYRVVFAVSEIDKTSKAYVDASKGNFFVNAAGISSSYYCVNKEEANEDYFDSSNRLKFYISFDENVSDDRENLIIVSKEAVNNILVINEYVDWSFSHRIDDWIVDAALEVDKEIKKYIVS